MSVANAIAEPPRPPLRYSLFADNLPPGRSQADRFRLAARAGYEGLEVMAVRDAREAAVIRDAACEAGLPIHSASVCDNKYNFLSAANPVGAIRDTLEALRVAKFWGAESLLITPARVDRDDSYHDAYERSQAVIRREILPVAQELGITLLIENIREIGFLLSPLEYARYIDEFESPCVRALLDIGNMTHGHPQHWVRTLGHRIAKLHVKDFHLRLGYAGRSTASFRVIGEGDMDWPALCAALVDVKFSGWATNAFAYPLSMRAVNYALRRLPRALREDIPLAAHAVRGLEWGIARSVLSEGTGRMRRYLRL